MAEEIWCFTEQKLERRLNVAEVNEKVLGTVQAPLRVVTDIVV